MDKITPYIVMLPLILYTYNLTLDSKIEIERRLDALENKQAEKIVFDVPVYVAGFDEVLKKFDVEVTYYCDCEKCTGSYDLTYTGTVPTVGRTVAVDPEVIPLGTEVYIENVGWRVAEDIGGAVKGRHVDVFVASHEEALQLGRHKSFILVKEEPNVL